MSESDQSFHVQVTILHMPGYMIIYLFADQWL